MMKFLPSLLLFFLLIDFYSPFQDRARMVKKIQEAQQDFSKGQFSEALAHVCLLEGDNVVLNFDKAHIYFQLKDSANAIKYYKKANSSARDSSLQSEILLQLGVLYGFSEPAIALTYFKESLRKNPDNDKARWNYENVLRKVSESDSLLTTKSTPINVMPETQDMSSIFKGLEEIDKKYQLRLLKDQADKSDVYPNW